jgi:hypothetical protein
MDRFSDFIWRKITENSWLMRDLWQTTNMNYGARWGLATNPKKLKSSGIKRLLERAIWEQGLRKPLTEGQKRHEWKAAHGFRKFYKSRAEQIMKPINVEITLGHDIGISASYYKPTQREVLDDYLRSVDLLAVQNDKLKLEKQISEIQEKSKDDTQIVNAKLIEKDKELQALKRQMFSIEQAQKETQKQLEALVRYRSKTMGMLMRTT